MAEQTKRPHSKSTIGRCSEYVGIRCVVGVMSRRSRYLSAQLFVSQCKKPKGIPYVGEKMSQTIARAIETKRHWPVPPPPSINVGQVHQNSTCWKSPTTLNEGGGAGGQDINTLVGSFFSHVRKHVCGNINFCFRRVASFHRKSKTNKHRK